MLSSEWHLKQNKKQSPPIPQASELSNPFTIWYNQSSYNQKIKTSPIKNSSETHLTWAPKLSSCFKVIAKVISSQTKFWGHLNILNWVLMVV